MNIAQKNSDSVVGIAISYGLEGKTFEIRQEEKFFAFPKPSTGVLWPTQHPIQWVTVFFPGDGQR